VAFGGVDVDALDVIPELWDVLPHFASINRDLVARAAHDPGVRLLTVDARHFVRATEHRYDVVVGDLFVPWRAGEGGMYTREHFQAVRDVLTAGGMFVQWLPLYQLRAEETRIIARTFLDVFPEASLTWLYFNAREPVVGLVGWTSPPSFDAISLLERMADPERKPLLTAAGLTDVRSVLGSRIVGAEPLAAWAGEAPAETRDHPRIEVWSGLGRFGDLAVRARLNLVEMLQLTSPVTQDELPGLTPHHFAAVLRHQRGLASYLRARHLDLYGGDAAEAMNAYAAAFLDIPDQRLPAYLLEQAIQEAVRRKAFAIAEVGIHAFLSMPDTAYLGHYYAAERSMSLGQVDAARTSLRQALAENPEHEPSWRLLTRIDPEAGS
jgi:spermidine synthase